MPSTENTASSSSTAMNKALANPLILSKIFEWISRDEAGFWLRNKKEEEEEEEDRPEDPETTHDIMGLACDLTLNDIEADEEEQQSYGIAGVLYRCTLVNRLWYAEAISHLWRIPEDGFYLPDSLASRLLAVSPSRRQFFANFVERLSGRPKEADGVYQGLKFPRLKAARFFVENGDVLPRFGWHDLECLELDPRYESSYPEIFTLYGDGMDGMLEQVVELYPNLRRLVFLDYALALPGTMAKFRKRMPRLEVDDARVIEREEQW